MKLKDMQDKCDEVSALMKHFSHPQRLLILCFLADGEKSVNEIALTVGLSQSQTSQFLKRMQIEGILEARKDKNFTFYFIENKDVLKLLKSLKQIFC